MNALRDLATFRPAPVGRCIYCGRTDDLRAEHILPFGLSGPAALPDASCGRCARITGAVEQEVLRGPLWPVRVFRDLKSRTKHRNAPRHVQLRLTYSDGRTEAVSVSIDEAPVVFIFPIFTPPAAVRPNGYTSGINVHGTATVGFGTDPKEFLKARGAKSLAINQSSRPATFARMLAKIAYATAYADGSLALVGWSSPVVSAILGESNDIGRWVGTFEGSFRKHPRLLHHIAARSYGDPPLLISEVQLFADSEAPTYAVVLGRIDS